MPASGRKWNAASLSLEVRLQAVSHKNRKLERAAQDGGAAASGFDRALGACAQSDAFWAGIVDITILKMLCCVNRAAYSLLAPTPLAFPYCEAYSKAFRLHSWEECYNWYNWKKNDMKHVEARDTLPPARTGGRGKQVFSLEDVLRYMVAKSGSMDVYTEGLARYRRNRVIKIKKQITYLLKNHPDDPVPAQLARRPPPRCLN